MRFIFYLILIFLVYQLIKGYLFSKKEVQGHKGKSIQTDEENEMVLDEMCNTYLPKESALKVTGSDNIHYFCSSGCRDKYLKSLIR